MVVHCPHCDEGAAERGVLCRACADALGACDGLLPEHLVSRVARGQGWLIDSWGQPHPIAEQGTVVGRLLTQTLAIFEHSVSRAHAELERDDQGWVVRDLGSKNGTFVDDEPVRGRGRLPHGARLRFGKVPFYFLASGAALLADREHAVQTVSATGAGSRARLLRDPNGTLELQLIEAGGRGVVLCRPAPAEPWSEMNLAPLEFALLCMLVERRRAASLEVEAHVPTEELARALPFRSSYASDENVRQAVKRLRLALQQVGVGDLIRSAPRRGYAVAWPVA